MDGHLVESKKSGKMIKVSLEVCNPCILDGLLTMKYKVTTPLVAKFIQVRQIPELKLEF